MDKVISLSTGTELYRFPADRLVYISADGNYSTITTLDNRKYMVSFQLGQVEDIIGRQIPEDDNRFIRIGRGLIVNSDFVTMIDTSRQILILSDCLHCYYELSASRKALILLKAQLGV